MNAKAKPNKPPNATNSRNFLFGNGLQESLGTDFRLDLWSNHYESASNVFPKINISQRHDRPMRLRLSAKVQLKCLGEVHDLSL